ncbi:MAG: hypothetical protein F6K62_10695 [Sphaerospermopsis sp. SIO1G2]|nr:hypothetical protein [Sphaerospermopsis sp. SIO1G2]
MPAVLHAYDNGQASTICNHIIQRDPVKYLSAEEAIARVQQQDGVLVRNKQSGRVALQMIESVLELETGAMTSRVKLQRPAHVDRMSLPEFNKSGWESVDAEVFHSCWTQEVADAPTQRVTEFYLISGVLLPVWKKLSKDNLKVCRLITDDGISLLGCVVMPVEIGSVYTAFRLDASDVSRR